MQRRVPFFTGPLKRPGQQQIRFWLFISAAEFLRYYQGEAAIVTVTAEDGRRIRFPARHLRDFITHEGIYGRFELRLDKNNRFIDLKKLKDLRTRY
ncbi:DUF2835 domain-containing protein [Magnetovirga frankeli]|uniref:DUF2835 domain-containing protein n=1 Tax=Magnetovirga frankeli TaxID=947516 RepID=UPI00129384A1|nr:DUF2835 domain-containing protein [gamma proteobacterium SS-5]